MSRSLILNLWNRIQHSLWLLPFLMTLFGLLLAFSLNLFDEYFPLSAWVGSYNINLQGISSLFSSIAGAIITALSTILSITLLVFTVLTGQYGGHVLRIFKVRLFSKFVIGWLSGTYVYLIYHIYLTTTDNGNGFVPELSILVGLLLTLITLFLLVMYIHFLVRQIQINTVINEVFEELKQHLTPFSPYKSPSADQQKVPSLPFEPVSLEKAGYIQNIDYESLKKSAETLNGVIEIKKKQGDFITSQETILDLYYQKLPSKKEIEAVKASFIVGEKRISVEDLLSSVNILNEIALKALSPGVNNLQIATECVDFLNEALSIACKKQFPEWLKFNQDNRLLLMTRQVTFEEFADQATGPIRLSAKNHPLILLNLMGGLLRAYQITPSDAYKKILKIHFEAVKKEALKGADSELEINKIQKMIIP